MCARCNKCVHKRHMRVDGEDYDVCLYILDAKRKRGCPTDENCDKFSSATAGVSRFKATYFT